jgi:hypothetical protein
MPQEGLVARRRCSLSKSSEIPTQGFALILRRKITTALKEPLQSRDSRDS